MTESSNPPIDPVFVILRDRIVALLQPFGPRHESPGWRGDYWISDDDTWPELVEIEFLNLDLLRPQVITSLQALLADYRDWAIAVRVEGTDETGKRRGMGLVVAFNRISDELQRAYLPEMFKDMGF